MYHHLARVTFVYYGLLLPEVGERWELGDAIVLGESFVVNLDEVHSEGVGVVVDLLQLLQHAVTRGAATSIWNHQNIDVLFC